MSGLPLSAILQKKKKNNTSRGGVKVQDGLQTTGTREPRSLLLEGQRSNLRGRGETRMNFNGFTGSEEEEEEEEERPHPIFFSANQMLHLNVEMFPGSWPSVMSQRGVANLR